MWDESERCKSATWRPLASLNLRWNLLLNYLSSRMLIKCCTDNRVVATIIEVGSMRIDLQKIAINIFQLCISNNISIDTQWIPPGENIRADYISRLIDPDK